MPRDAIRKAQTAAKTYLEMRGYEIVEQNWRQSRNKVDIIAKKDGVVYFVAVHYELNDSKSSGPDAINASKLKQLQQAALAWVTDYKWQGKYRLSSIDIDSTNYAVLSFIDNEF